MHQQMLSRPTPSSGRSMLTGRAPVPSALGTCSRAPASVQTTLRRKDSSAWPSASSPPQAPRQRGPAPCQATGQVIREVLRRQDRTKLDEGDDRGFYDYPRLVKHVDEYFLDQVTQLYRERIPERGTVLDLCSSWVSHLPNDVFYSKVVGHGMNAAELARNPRLDTFFVRDLNVAPTGWALQDNSFDAVICCVSVQYMQRPEEVFSEIYRVLKPGGVAIFTFSNRMFYSKAIAAWREAPSGYARVQLVKQYFMAVDGFSTPEALTQVAMPGQKKPLSAQLPGPLSAVAKLFERSASDPFYAVLAYKGEKPAPKPAATD